MIFNVNLYLYVDLFFFSSSFSLFVVSSFAHPLVGWQSCRIFNANLLVKKIVIKIEDEASRTMYLWHYVYTVLTICWFDQKFVGFFLLFSFAPKKRNHIAYVMFSSSSQLYRIFVCQSTSRAVFICKYTLQHAITFCTNEMSVHSKSFCLLAERVRIPFGNQLSGQLQNIILAYYFLELCCAIPQ